MLSLFFRNLFFTLLQPGTVAGLFPYWIVGRRFFLAFSHPFTGLQYTALLLFLVGLIVLLYCITLFAVIGRGTLSPVDPTKKLVISGLYKHSRNPMYVGVMLMLVAECLFFASRDLWIYTGFVFIGFNLFILVHEEHRLEKDFGTEYSQYRKKVRRWL